MKTLNILILMLAVQSSVNAQSQEVTQLLLNYEKLKQLEEILDNMYKGYQTLSEGYARIKNVAEGNFKLHDVFLSGLMEVSPAVRAYHKIPTILKYHKILVNQASRSFGQDLSEDELKYVKSVYENLIKESRQGIEELVWVATAGKSRMSDAERMEVIDGIFSEASLRLSFIRDFNSEVELLRAQRMNEMGQVRASRKLQSND